jgi:hypothetical protein
VASLGPELVTLTMKVTSPPESTLELPVPLATERFAVGVGPCTVKRALNSSEPLLETTLAFHVPRLSTTKFPIIVVGSVGKLNESVWGSLVIGVKVLIKPAGSVQAKRRPKAKLTPVASAQTTSPKLKSVLGVTQSAA